MDYFVVEGNKEAAEAFSAECGIVPDMDLQEMDVRTQIRDALLAGDVVTAIERVNELNPEVRIQGVERKSFFMHHAKRSSPCGVKKPNHHLSTDRRQPR